MLVTQPDRSRPHSQRGGDRATCTGELEGNNRHARQELYAPSHSLFAMPENRLVLPMAFAAGPGCLQPTPAERVARPRPEQNVTLQNLALTVTMAYATSKFAWLERERITSGLQKVRNAGSFGLMARARIRGKQGQFPLFGG